MSTIIIGATCLLGALAMWFRHRISGQRPAQRLERYYNIAPDIDVGIIYDGRIISVLNHAGGLHNLLYAVRDDTLITYNFSSGYELNIHCGRTNIGYSLERNGDLLSIGPLAVSTEWPKLSTELDWIGERMVHKTIDHVVREDPKDT